ncbi:unnamed protein product [Effrenium voratum]|uniref:protein disulfide-isomerase n=1 Tax=Effrenium voratum TaxID=2562239 RepID=A0AA36HNX6_9DINO|nr:unnamed protein product [Effrenium voratum]CAJ1459620.1 unnamed protein product [Effrenium voratum]
MFCHVARPMWSLLWTWLLAKAGAVRRPQMRWAQSNATLFLELKPARGSTCELSAQIRLDRVLISDCSLWDIELREDVVVQESRVERSGRATLLSLRKKLPHRWDRPFMEEDSYTLPRDWRREDRDLPEEDEIELVRAQNLRRLGGRQLRELARDKVLVLALRYPWCSACEEKDQAFVKLSKVAGGKPAFAEVQFGSVDLREEKELARQVWADGLQNCSKSCPLHVFKPDEPFEEPYKLQVHLLYEMDEAAMMGDPMAGMPGHAPKSQTAKPDFDRFERDLALLLPPAVTQLGEDQEEDFRNTTSTAVIGGAVNLTSFRLAARRLRGIAAFGALPPILSAADATVKLWREGRAVVYDGNLSHSSYLEHFARVHAQPLLQNYSWDLKDQVDAIGMPIGVLWLNYSNYSNSSQKALSAFRQLCAKRRGTNSTRHILCCVMDQSFAYYQRDYGSHEPYPFPFFGLTTKLGFGAADRFGFPFNEPVNASVFGFFSNSKSAFRRMDSWAGRVLRGRVAPSHESGLGSSAKWRRGEVQNVVWKTFQQEINGSTADVLLEVYDDQRKRNHILTATMDVLARTLKDYANLKVARMESSQNYVPPIFGRKQFSKETEYYWVPPSIATGEWAPTPPVRYPGDVEDVTPAQLLRFFKKHTLSSWSLKEALEASADIGEEVMGHARVQQQMDDRAEEDKQQMIKKMMTTLKKEKGLVDVGEMMGLKKAADALDLEAEKPKPKRGKGRAAEVSPEEEEERRKRRREQLKKDEEKQKDIARKDKEKRKRRLEADKQRKEKKKQEEALRLEAAKKAAEEKRRKKEQEKLRQPATPLFSWGQSKEQLRISVSVPKMKEDSLRVSLAPDRVSLRALDWQMRPHLLDFELREFVDVENSSWAASAEGALLTLQKSIFHRWDRLAQNHSAVKNFLRKDWVQDDGALEEDQEDVELPSGANIKKVSEETMGKVLQTHSLLVLAPRFPWCDKCKEKDREFAKAARISREKDHLEMVAFGVLDAREEKHLARKHNVSCSEECELLLFKEDEEEPYTVPGRRFAEEIQIDCYKHLLPVVSEIANRSQFERVRSAFDTAIMGFFQGTKESDQWYPRFRAVARQLRGHALFGAVFQGLPSDMGIDFRPTTVAASDGRPLVLLFKPKEQRHVEFTGDLTLETLSHFSKVLSLPLLSQYTPESRQKIQELKVPAAMLWLDGEETAVSAAAQEVVREVAARFSGHLVFMSLNATRDGFLMRPFGLDPRRVPAFGISASESPESQKFALEPVDWNDHEAAASGVEDFCGAFLNGSLEAAHESAELPKTYAWQGPGYVEEVVWKTFRRSISGGLESHDVLLELYSPYRPQHRTHVVVLDLVAEVLQNLTALKVARMDTANNYVPPEFGLKDKDQSSSIFFLTQHRAPKRFVPKAAKLEDLPLKMIRFLHRESRGTWDLDKGLALAKQEAQRRVRRLKALEKDYEKKMQDEWMQKEMEEFERYKRMGKFDNLNI